MLFCLLGGGFGACAQAPDQALDGVPDLPLQPAKAEPEEKERTLSPEIGMDAPVLGPASGWQDCPAAAFNGSHYLVVWGDDQDPAGPRLYGARVAPDGEMVDPIGIPLGRGWCGAVASDGEGFLIVTSPVEAEGGPIRGMRVSAEGEVIDPEGVVLAQAGAPVSVTVGFDGASYQVAWGYGDYLPVRRIRVSREAAVIDPGNTPVTPAGMAPQMACGAAGCLLLWQDAEGLKAARLDAQGSPPDPVAGLIAPSVPDAKPPSIAASVAAVGAGYMIAWLEEDGDASRVRATRVSAEGDLLDPGGVIAIEETEEDNQIGGPLVVFDGTEVLVTWPRILGVHGGDSGISGVELHLTRMTTGGAVVDAPDLLVSPSMGPFTAASDGAAALLVWRERYEGATRRWWTLRAARIDARAPLSGAPPSRVVSSAANAQQHPAAAFDGHNFLVVWSDDRSVQEGKGSDIYGARVSPAGEVLDDPAILIASTAAPQVDPRVVFDGRSSLVLWSDYHDGGEVPGASLFGARVSPEGEVLDPSPIDLTLFSEWSLGWSSPYAAATGGAGTLVIGDHEGAMVAVDQDGAVRDLGPFLGHGGYLDGVALASSGAAYLVVWESDHRLLGARLSPEGAPLDPAPFVIAPESSLHNQHAIASDGAGYLVVWTHGQDTGDGPAPEVIAARVSAAGEVLDPAGILLHAGHIEGSPAVSFDGERWMVTWSALEEEVAPGSARVRAAEISREGVVTSTYAVAAPPGLDGTPAVASTDSGTTLFAYARFEADPPHEARRVKARLLGAVPADNALAHPLVIGCSCRAAGEGPASRPLLFPALLALSALLARRARRRAS